LEKSLKYLAVNPHAHSDFSLDGASSPGDLVKHAKSLGWIAHALTDHGTMGGLASHWTACKKHGLIPIQGIEAYIEDPFLQEKVDRFGNKTRSYHHLSLLFKTRKAYEYFCKLSPDADARAVVKYGERKPIILWEDLAAIKEDIVLGSSCLVGFVQEHVNGGRLDIAEKAYLALRNLVGPDNFFVEIMVGIIDKDYVKPIVDKTSRMILTPGRFDPIGKDIQKAPNQFVLDMARKYGDSSRVLLSLDAHYAEASDYDIQNVRLGHGRQAWKFSNKFYQKTVEEISRDIKEQLGVSDDEIAQWIDNSYEFVKLFKDYSFRTAKTDGWLLPSSIQVYGEEVRGLSSKQILKQIVAKHGRFPPKDHPLRKVYSDRYNYEVSVITDNGKFDLLPYFFVLEDIISWCKSQDILVNARGSGGGCLLGYLLGITITDPIKYDLPFERFITLGRIISGSLPDFDIDFSERDRVFVHVKEEYGDMFTQLSINKKMKVKTSIKDVERDTIGFVRAETEKMCKELPTIPQGVEEDKWLWGYTEETTGEEVPGFWDKDESHDLRDYAEENKEIWDKVVKCLGVQRERAPHPCGCLISPVPIHEIMPTMRLGDISAVACNPKDVEEVGGVKYDFLSLTTLDALSFTIRELKKMKGIDLEWNEFPYDSKVYEEIIHKDLLESVFQISTDTMKPFVLRLKPKTVEEIGNIIALVRPGCLDAPSPNPSDPPEVSAAEYYIRCVEGTSTPYYIHPDLESILKNTMGVLLFQEQALKIFRDIAGYSFEQAERCRKGIGKKDRVLIEKELAVLKQKSLERGWSEEQAKKLCDTIVASSRYSFNCVAGSQKVQTLSGLVSMSEVAKNYEKYSVLTVAQDGKMTYMTPSHGEKTGHKKIYVVELDNGGSIRATGDHKFLSSGVWKTLTDIIDNGLEIDVFEKENYL
jgi:DNA polymerase-3 subunit alpha